MLRLIHSLHDGKKAEVTVDGQVAPEFEVRNGLRQGCVIAPGKAVTRKRFAVSGLKDVKINEKYMEKVSELVKGSWDEVSSGAEIWEGLVGATEATLGWETRKQPD